LTDVVAVALITAVPATIAAIAAVRASRGIRLNRKMMDTGNAKDIGTTVHDLAQTTEIIVAQSHINTNELLGLRAEFREHLDNVQAVMKEHEGVWAEMEQIYDTRAKTPKAQPGA
jgi:hypothetical protein